MKPSATPEFRKLVAALGPYLDDLVVVGGWAHRLMTEHEVAARLAFEPLMTLDADLAGRERLPVRGDSLRRRLLDAGFPSTRSSAGFRLAIGWNIRQSLALNVTKAI